MSDEAESSRRSDEHWDDRGPWRPCHVCSSKVTAGPFCSVCDHPLCSTCICDLSIEPVGSQRKSTIGKQPTVSFPLREDAAAYGRLPYGPDLKNSPFLRADLSKRSLPGVTQARVVDVDARVQHPLVSDCVPKRADSHPQRRNSGLERLDIGASEVTEDVTSHLSRHQSVNLMATDVNSPSLPSRVQNVRPYGSTTIDHLHGAQVEDGPVKRTRHGDEVDQGQHIPDHSIPDHPAAGLASHAARLGHGKYASKESTTIATSSNPSPFTIPTPLIRKLSTTQRESEDKGVNPTPRLRKMQSAQLIKSKQDGFYSPEMRQATQQSAQPLQSLRSRLSKFSTRSTSELVERWNGEVRSSRRGSQARPYLDYRSDLRHHESEQTTPRAKIPTTDFRGLLKHYSPPGPVSKTPSSPALSRQPSMRNPLDRRPSEMAKKHSTHRSRGSYDACGYCEPEGTYGSLSAVPEQEVWDKDASSPPPGRGRALSRHTSGNRGSIPEQGQIHGEERPLRRTKTHDNHEWAKLRGSVGRDTGTSPPTSAYATGMSEGTVSTTITGTSPHVVVAQRPVPYRLSDHDCE